MTPKSVDSSMQIIILLRVMALLAGICLRIASIVPQMVLIPVVHVSIVGIFGMIVLYVAVKQFTKNWKIFQELYLMGFPLISLSAFGQWVKQCLFTNLIFLLFWRIL